MIWEFGDEVKIACFLVFGANATTSLLFSEHLNGADHPPSGQGRIRSGQVDLA